MIENDGPDISELDERSKVIQDLDAEVKSLRNEVKQKDIVIDKLESDLRRYRMEPFVDDDFEGVRRYEEERGIPS